MYFSLLTNNLFYFFLERNSFFKKKKKKIKQCEVNQQIPPQQNVDAKALLMGLSILHLGPHSLLALGASCVTTWQWRRAR
jgi:hypothetical protein